MQYMALGINALSGYVPKELGNLVNLISLSFSTNNLNGSLPSELGNLVKLEQLWASDNDFTGKIPDYIGSWSNLTDLILRNCRISDSLMSINFTQFSELKLLDLSFNNITGYVPEDLLSLVSLQYLFLGNNSLSGSLPDYISSSLTLDLSYNQFTGVFPPWFGQTNFQLNLVGNNFFINYSNSVTVPFGLDCLQRDAPCFRGSPQSTSFAIDCGSSKSISGSDNSMYSRDNSNLGYSSYYVTEAGTWGVSNVGKFIDAFQGNDIIYSSRQFQNTTDMELFQTARMSTSSLRYYGIGLENGNYAVTLQFAEFSFEDSQTWTSVGRRVFDIYVQGELKEKNFDIRKEAGGKSYTAVKKQYIVPITRNFLEIHLFWAGKGTCCIPNQGYYGPTISALSVTSTHKAAHDKKNSSRTGIVAGVVAGVAVLGLVMLAGLYVQKRQKMEKSSREQQELYSIVGRPNVFSYSELRTSTKNFSSMNLLGEGGYGSVYKGKLINGSMVAVKQLSETSHQGKNQFIAEIETISRVQHRNLVKLHGCCLEGKNPLLVYEYLENGSLDKALFGDGRLTLDWPTRFEICLGIARGLSYLHEESSIRVVHRDIKASNVLLDANLNPKISDFGLAKLYDDKKTHVSTKVAGTFGYLAPEYAMRGHMTEKVDVFAFGVVILETIAGRPNYDGRIGEDKAYLLEWVWQLYEEDRPIDIADPRLTEFNGEEMLRAIRVGLLCIQSSPRQRPPMSRVVSMLAGDIEVPEAVTKPSYVTEWQSNPGGTTSSAMSSASPFLSSVIDEGR
ncbi:unnamed protein product [Urochloa humidicola]